MEKDRIESLVNRAQSGDLQAMGKLLEVAHTSVSYQCRKMMRRQEDAEDLTQEVLLAVYRKIDTLKEAKAFWSWLNRITATHCMNALSRNHVDLQFAEDEDGHSVVDNLEEIDEHSIPDKALDNAETARMIDEIVSSLPEAQRMSTLLYYYNEMSVKEIAQIMNVPENTVKSRLNLARKAIKDKVQDYEKQGIKLYSVSILPFLWYFLRTAAESQANAGAATACASGVMTAGAVAGGTATLVGGTTVAGSVATHSIKFLIIKIVSGIVAATIAITTLIGITHPELFSSIFDVEPESSVDSTSILNDLSAYSFEPCDVVKNSDPADLYCQIADIYLSPKEYLTVREFMDRIKESKLYDDLTFTVCLDLESYEFIDYTPDCPAPSNGGIFVSYKGAKMFNIEVLNPTNSTEIKDCYAFEIHDLYYYHNRSALDIKDFVWYYNGIPYSAAGYSVNSIKDNLSAFVSQYSTYDNFVCDEEKTFIRTDIKYEETVFVEKFNASFDFEWSYCIICDKSTGNIDRFECGTYAQLNTDSDVQIEVTNEYIMGVFYLAQEMYDKYIYGRTYPVTDLTYTPDNCVIEYNGCYLEKLDDWDSYEHFIINLENRFSKATVSKIVSQIQLVNNNGAAYCNLKEGVTDPIGGDYKVECVEKISEYKYKIQISFLTLDFKQESIDMYCIYENENWVIDSTTFYGQ